MKIPEELNDQSTWGATKVGSVAFIDGCVWRKTVDGWAPSSINHLAWCSNSRGAGCGNAPALDCALAEFDHELSRAGVVSK